MRFSGTDSDRNEPWFRIGDIPVTTTIFVLLVWLATLVVFSIEGRGGFVNSHLWLYPDSVTSGEVWRLVTWPWAHLDFTLGAIFAAVLFGLFGSDIERTVGRRPYLVLLGSSIAIIGVAAVVFSTVLGRPTLILDLALVELTMVLLFIAERPNVSFFFPWLKAWMVGAVIVALEIVNDLADRDWVRLLTVLVAAFFIALVARSVGLLADYARVPDVSLPRRKPRADRSSSSGRGPARPANPSSAPKKRTGPLWGKGREVEEAEIVQMPTQPNRFSVIS
ncbi:MAG: rhomboid family intramembrane serine protease, partial [Solirubrobacteraceae bacterium]|nr:rhomboid family intramembrane serine protease [Solirubrobacteraceae bacterium]